MSEWKSPRTDRFPNPPFATEEKNTPVVVGQVIGGFLSIWIVVSLAFYGVANIIDLDVTWQEAGLVGLIYVFFRAHDKVTFGRVPK